MLDLVLISSLVRPYPSDHVFYRTLSVCPFDLRKKDPRHVYTFGVKAPPNSKYARFALHAEDKIDPLLTHY